MNYRLTQTHQMPLNLAPEQATAQNLPWDGDEYLSSEYFSNTYSSPELADYVQAGHPFNYVPSSDATPSHDADMQSPTNSTNECSTTTIQQSQLSTQMVQAPLMSEIQLREASSKPKNRKYKVTSNTTAHIRECHHLAEKQYRTRLKSQFESLLAVLPASRTRTLADRDSMQSSGQVLSRGQVLDLARERILELEEEIGLLMNAMSDGCPLVWPAHRFMGISMAGYALMCQIIALRVLAAPTMSASDLQGEADQYTSNFKNHATAVLGVAYEKFPPFVKKFKPNYTDTGPNLNPWFRMWYNETHVKNYVGWTGSDRNVEDDQKLYPLACDDDEGIYPAAEFRFDEANHPLSGPATLISRMEGAFVSIYNCEYTGANSNVGDMSGANSAGLTKTTDPQYWCSGVESTQALFNVLPLSSEDIGGNPAPGFLLSVANPPSDAQHGIFDPQFPSTVTPNTQSPGTFSSKQQYWILRDDGLDQTSWVQTQDSASTAPGDESEASSPNP
ncbi:hypothetical protein LZL87_011472 [Fusarium oxysporum]|nr:hypothetical protein LZL87_011472 [Fusarium oxysporum]